MAEVLDIEGLLKRPIRNRVSSVGLELEGGWKVPPFDEQMHQDASVDRAKKWDRQEYRFVGEVVSNPMLPIGMKAWVEKVFPHKIDNSCGLHIHMGFDNLWHYGLLMDREDYQETMLEKIKEWGQKNELPKGHCLWDRLKGKNKYCVKKFWPDLQAQPNRKQYMAEWEREGQPAPEGHRYTQVNFCFGVHKTLEWRVLPMFDTPEMCLSALHLVLAVTNASIVRLARMEKESPINVDLVLSGRGGYHEVFEEVV